MYHMYRLYGHENRELREISGKFSLGQFENLGHYSSNQHTKPNIWNPTIRDFDDFWNICSFMGKNDKSEKNWRSDHRFGFYGVMVVWYKGRNRAISAPSYII